MLSLNNCAQTLKKGKRIGRGGSRGGTSGRGNKGQKGRTSGTVPVYFEGGQMPLTRRLPKRGFNNKKFAEKWVTVNTGSLNKVFDAGAEITRELLIERGVVKISGKARLKVLGHGALDKKFVIYADAFSDSAIASIKGQGGEAHIVMKSA
jgi:large subunit ribosomal protein L15